MNERIRYFDLARVVAILGVIVIHAVTTLAYQPPTATPSVEWWYANIVQSLFKWGVPLLIMQSGYLLLSKKNEGIGEFLQKRFSKIFLPFLVWNMVYALVVALDSGQSIPVVLIKSLTGSIFYHLWFIYILVGLYLVTPIVRVFVAHASKKLLLYFLLLWFFVSGINPVINLLFGNDIELIIPLVSGYIGYFVLGYYLETYSLSKQNTILLYVAGIVGFFLSIISGYILPAANGQAHLFFQEYVSISIIAFSAAVFVASKRFKLFSRFDTTFYGKLNIARICYGVYLSHALVLTILKYYFGISAEAVQPIASSLLAIFLTATICFGIFVVVDLLQKLKPVRIASKFLY